MYLSDWARSCSSTGCQDCRLQTGSHALGSDAKQSSGQRAGLILPTELTALWKDSDRQSQGIAQKFQGKLPKEKRRHKDLQVPKRSMCLESAHTSAHYSTNALQSHAVLQIKCSIWYIKIYWSIFPCPLNMHVQIFYIPFGISHYKPSAA